MSKRVSFFFAVCATVAMSFSPSAARATFIYDISVTGGFTGSGQISFATMSGFEQVGGPGGFTDF